MIQEAYCSFELSKLFKEKGFVQETLMVYNQNGNFMPNGAIEDTYQIFYPAPTHQMAMAWLREVHNIFIVIEPYSNTSCYFSLWEGDNYYENPLRKGFPSYEETVEQALKYCLKKNN